ncbi:MAG TPA: GxxExxY protein [Hanamia sp.]|nr:GxxExxY protein [Hanamia sp.]
MENIIYKNEIYEIVGVCMEVYNKLGYGFLEVVYKDAMEIEFMNNQVPNEREKEFKIEYKGHILKRTFNADFYMMNKIIVKVKSSKEGLVKENIA